MGEETLDLEGHRWKRGRSKRCTEKKEEKRKLYL